MKNLKIIIALSIALIMFSGFWDNKTKRELRKERFIEQQSRIRMNNETLQLLYKYAPEAKRELLKSYGYATFSSTGVTVVFLSFEGGHGLAHNNRNGRNTYMNMKSGGLGLGLGAKDFKIVFLFENKKVYDRFIKSGWEANAQVDATAKYKEKGGTANGAITVSKGVRLYKITQDGLLLQATLQGTKYSKDEDLN
jgi:hypothetical protein